MARPSLASTSLNLFSTLILILALNPHTVATKECYLMNGQSAKSSHTSCIADLGETEHSPCCALATDICLESGLCLASNGLMYETGCTDPTWEDDACPRVCPDQRGNWTGNAIGDWTEGEEREYWQVQACSGNKVCCRSSSTVGSCCEGGNNGGEEGLVVEFNPGMPVFTSKRGGSGGTTTTKTKTTTVVEVMTVTVDGSGVTSTGEGSPLPTCAQVEGEGEQAGTAAVCEGTTDCSKRETTVGAAVGASLGAALVATLGAIWFLLQRQKKLAAALGQYQAVDGQGVNSMVYAQTGPVNRNMARPFAELDAERKQHELSSESSVSSS
ncbi:hypothetical protein BJY04DRAFT_217883 [Aspergillus karnatakaensis]|uniref:uncharacterized protein n=1 Tax=Aspergillus karnatakaensis TaxID=1810916 RepID=UPI003CCCA5B7